MVIRKYYSQVYFSRFENFNELHKFLETHNLSKLIPEEIESTQMSVPLNKPSNLNSSHQEKN